jgi:RNA ligase
MFRKYPRTPHLESSRLQPGDEDLDAVPFAAIRGQFTVVEEKLDGANSGLSFAADGTVILQSRGHVLSGGPRERHFGPMKAWASTIAPPVFDRIGDRYIVFGEWLYAKHTVFYDALPHYFCEFDVYDRHTDTYLSTARRRELLAGLPLVSVPVLHAGPATTLAALTAHAGPSTCRTPGWRSALATAATVAGCDPARVAAETDRDDAMEGLYLKIEDQDQVVRRLKWVRPSFLTSILDSGTHWLDRPIVVNRLVDATVMYAGV